MDNEIFQCLQDSKLMLMHAEKQEWDAFILLHPLWEVEVNNFVIGRQDQYESEEMKKILVELIEDIEKIRNLIKERMSEIEKEYSHVIKQKKAVDSYLKHP